MSLAAAALPARALDVDFDVALIVLDDYLSLSGLTTQLAGADNDANGLKEEDQLGMLSAILAGGSGVSCIDAGRVTAITNGFNSNFTKVKQELVVNVSGFGTVDIVNQLASSNAQLGAALQNTLAGFMTIADTSTIAFVNQLSDSLAAAFLTSINQTGQISSVQNQINFLASDYETYGNAPPGPNYLGPAGDIENDGQSNLAEYTVGAVPKGRELWLADCCITAPLRIVTVSGGGLKVSGLSETFAVTVAGGNSGKTFSWRKGTSTSYTVVSTSPSYTINFLTTGSSGNYFCVISDGTTTRTTPNLTLSVTFVPLYFTQQPQGATKQLGRSHTFSCTVQGGAGPGPYQYTWRRGSTVVGTNSPTYTINSITAGDAGTYTVRVTSNGGGDTITSQNAVLTVGSSAFSILQQPVNTRLYVGQAFTLTVIASGGSGNFQYTWTKNGDTLAVTTVGELGTASIQLSDAGTYRCTVRDLNTSAQLTTDPAVIEVAAPLSITDQPDGATVSIGQQFALSVAATGGYAPLSYQWQWEGLNIPGQTSATYTAIAYSGFAGDFTCVVTDANGQQAVSAPAVLSVNATVEITLHPQGGDFYTGESTTLTVAATGAGLTYDWRRNGVSLGAPSAASLTLNGLGSGDAGDYTVVVSSPGVDPAVSLPATLRVRALPAINTQPKGGTLYLGEDYTLTIAASGGYDPLLYQWRKSSVAIDNAIDASFSLDDVEAADQGTYTCVVTDQRGTVLTSAAALLFVVPQLAIVEQPLGGTAYAGEPFSLSVGTTGGAPLLAYAWRRNGQPFGAPNAPELDFPSVTLAEDGEYTCTITDGRGASLTTEPAALDVELVPEITEDPAPQALYAGETLTLSVGVAGGFPPLTYVWRRNGVPINGANNAVYTKAGITEDDAGNYACTILDRFSRLVTSETAAVTVAETLEVTIGPAEAKKYSGESVTIAAGAPPLPNNYTYTWRRDGVAIGAPSAAVLQLNDLVPGDSGAYTCLITSNSGAGAETAPCALEVRNLPSFATGPEDDTAAVGTAASFTVETAGGFEPLTLAWRKGAATLDGEAGTTLLLPQASVTDAGQYRCVVTDALGTEALSEPAQLTVVPALAVDTQAQDAAAYLGEAAGLVFLVSGGVPPVTYTWYRGDTEAGSGSTLEVAPVSESNSGAYRCIAVDADGNALESETVTLLTGEPLAITLQPGSYDRYTGEAVTISVETSGGVGTLAYRWLRNAQELDIDGPSVALTNVTPADSGNYICFISDMAGEINTDAAAMLNVADPLAATAETRQLTVFEGATATAAVTVSDGFAPYTYAWYRGEELVSTEAALTLTEITSADAGTYSCIVSDKYTSAPPVAALVLTVNAGLRPQSADINADNVITLSELLRAIQFYTFGAFHCEDGTEDGYAPGPGDTESCLAHTTDYAPQNWAFSLSELLRLIQFYSTGGYYACPEDGTEDGYCPGLPPAE